MIQEGSWRKLWLVNSQKVVLCAMTFFVRSPFWLTIYHILSRAARVNRYALLSFMAASPHTASTLPLCTTTDKQPPQPPLIPTITDTTTISSISSMAISVAVILKSLLSACLVILTIITMRY